MNKILFFSALFLYSTATFGQEDMPSYFKKKVEECLAQKDCDNAQIMYDSYKKSSGRTNKDMETRIETCVFEYRFKSSQGLIDFAMKSNTKSFYGNDKYKGQKSFGRRNGLGAYCWDNQDFYFGGFRGGNREGTGIYIIGNLEDSSYVKNCPDCKFYCGGWSNGKKSGQGACYDKTGKRIYFGIFIDDKPSETYNPSTNSDDSFKLRIIFDNKKNVYVGETESQKRNGIGIYLWQNGDMWYGKWTDDMRDGYGIHIYEEGIMRTGTWDDNDYTP